MTGAAAPAVNARHIDLHLHSTASDGTNAPEVVVLAARDAGLQALALTDHDTVDGIPPARAAAQEHGIELVPGVELSAYEASDEIHILGLHLALLDEMGNSLAVFRMARRERAEGIVKLLNGLGVRITFEDVLAVARDAAIGRPHIARAMVENGWAMDLRDAFDRYLGAGRPAYLDKRRITIPEAIELIHRCGGIAVLAHPGPDATHERMTLGRDRETSVLDERVSIHEVGDVLPGGTTIAGASALDRIGPRRVFGQGAALQQLRMVGSDRLVRHGVVMLTRCDI